MFKKGADFLGRERTCEPLHIVLHKHLNRSAFDRTTALDRSVHAAADGHVRAQENLVLCHVERSRDISHGCSCSIPKRTAANKIANNTPSARTPIGFNRRAYDSPTTAR